MMNGFGIFMMMAWMPLVMLLGLIVTVVVIWLVIRWLNQERPRTTLYTPPLQQGFSQPYEQGYQPPQSAPEAYQEGEKQFNYPQSEYEQPQILYPEQQKMPPSR